MGGSGELALREVDGWTVGFRDGDSEPLVRDLDLGERLGFERPRKIRELIDRMENDGKIAAVFRRPTVGRRGFAEEIIDERWLTEAQALKVAAKSDTDVADALLDEMIRVYMLARRGELPQQRATSVIQDDRESQLRLLALRQRLGLELLSAAPPGVLSEDYIRHKVEHSWALVTGQAPVLESQLLDVQGYLRSRGLPDATIRSKSSTFGKRVKAAYVAQHGEAPKMLHRDINGSSREVASYTERDRPLFDRVFAEMFGAAIVEAASGAP
ncbi:hypothetical protein [Sorangium sp. So ce204]|uniref:hypothetical protein n=1 Tax=Sorangium sp. So ce204 TaxID=3133288 RepID=UPI003F5D7F37